jgi:histidine triad (HIT) family protein
MSECLFCRIVNREIPADVVYEDDQILAFKDIFPQAPVHVLIIPKAHCAGLNDLRPEFEGVLGRIPFISAQIARDAGCATSGYRLLSNCGANAGQTVFHLHYHLLGGKELGGKLCQ